MSENPNPSGFRSGRFFINLDAVIATRPCGVWEEKILVLFALSDHQPDPPDDHDNWVEFVMVPDEIDRFLDELEIYHSKR